MKTGAQYIEEMKKMRPNIYVGGQLVTDEWENGATRMGMLTAAKSFDASFDPEKEALYTTTSALTGKKAHRWNTLMASMEDMMGDLDMKRDQWQMLGTCPGPVCTGWEIANALWGVTYEMDEEYGTEYHERLKKFMIFMEEKSLSISGALTDAKGDRSKKPSQQDDPDVYVHVVERRPDGVVIRGYKNQIGAVGGSQYMFVMPTTSLGEGEEDYAIACVLPRDEEGVKIVLTRHPNDSRGGEPGWDTVRNGAPTGYVIFDNVFVPNERIFMNGETKYAGKAIGNFTAIYRACIGACVAGQCDVLMGAALGLARANGLTMKPFSDKFVKMSLNTETTYGMGVAAIAKGRKHKSGAFYPDPLLAHATKIYVAHLPVETKELAQEIGGGIAETGCMPSYTDMMNPEYGPTLMKTLKAAPDVSAEDRIKMARLVEWVCVAGGGCMHGGGSPDTARAVVKAATKWDRDVDLARSLADVEAPLKEIKKK